MIPKLESRAFWEDSLILNHHLLPNFVTKCQEDIPVPVNASVFSRQRFNFLRFFAGEITGLPYEQQFMKLTHDPIHNPLILRPNLGRRKHVPWCFLSQKLHGVSMEYFGQIIMVHPSKKSKSLQLAHFASASISGVHPHLDLDYTWLGSPPNSPHFLGFFLP